MSAKPQPKQFIQGEREITLREGERERKRKRESRGSQREREREREIDRKKTTLREINCCLASFHTLQCQQE